MVNDTNKNFAENAEGAIWKLVLKKDISDADPYAKREWQD